MDRSKEMVSSAEQDCLQLLNAASTDGAWGLEVPRWLNRELAPIAGRWNPQTVSHLERGSDTNFL